MNRWVLFTLQFIVIIILISILLCLYDFLTTINGIVLIGDNISFDDLNRKILYVSIVRSKLQFIKFLPLFTKSISHFSTFIITDKYFFIVSPRGKILYITKLKSSDIDLTNNNIITSDDKYVIDKKYVKFNKKISVIQFAKYEKHLMEMNRYSFYGHNCQEVTIKTIAHFEPKFKKKYVSGLNLLLDNITDIVNIDSHL